MAAPLRLPCSCLSRSWTKQLSEVARPSRTRALSTSPEALQQTDASPPPLPDVPSPRFSPVASTSAEPYTSPARPETPVAGLLYATSLEELQDFRIVEPGEGEIEAFFERHLAPLTFDAVLSTRTMTHPLAAGPHGNHNGKLASLGKHVLRAHLAAFVNSHRHLLPDDIEIDAGWLTEVLTQKRLGEGAGEALGVARAMRYRETLNVDGAFPRIVHRGQAIEALNGVVYKQHGALTSLRFFHSRILPHLAYPREWTNAVQLAASTDADLGGKGSYALDRQQEKARRTLEVSSEASL